MTTPDEPTETYRTRLNERPEVATIDGPEEVALTRKSAKAWIYTKRSEGIYALTVERNAVDDIAAFLDSDVAQEAARHTVYVPTEETARALSKTLLGRPCLLETRIEIHYETDGDHKRFRPAFVEQLIIDDNTAAVERFLEGYTEKVDGEAIEHQALTERYSVWLANCTMEPVQSTPEASKAFNSVARTEQSPSGLAWHLPDRRWSVEDDS